MSFVLKPWHLWVVAFAGWINQLQEQTVQSYGEKMLPSVKVFGDGELSMAKYRDFGRDSGWKRALSVGANAANQSGPCTSAGFGRLGTMMQQARGMSGQAAFR